MWSLLAACTPHPDGGAPRCDGGLDLDGDGVCDRERADWSLTAPPGDRHDIYELGEEDLAAVRADGLRYVSEWPVDVSGLLLPYGALSRAFDEMGDAAEPVLGYGSLDAMYEWLGLAPWPDPDATGIYALERPDDAVSDFVGVGLVRTPDGDAVTFSCAACHASSFFGRTVLGLTNRETRANEYLHGARLFFPSLEADVFAGISDADEGELALFERTQRNLRAVGTRIPAVQGLDTSLAQVALSLAKRSDDAWATKDPALEVEPRPNDLETFVADSKPAVWWTLRYKTRWLSDGAIWGGNPIFTNFLWNELGRGTDLRELDAWFDSHGAEVDALTVAVFATDAPRWTDFFPFGEADLAAARRGEPVFADRCASCHGTYEKAWSHGVGGLPDAIATVSVDYGPTEVLDVGTDPQRALGMAAFAEGLNGLQLSRDTGTVVVVQDGYVPPPLDGIFARYPYLHHGAVPTLCALLSPAAERPTGFWMGPTADVATDIDLDCVGYPTGDAVPPAWTEDPRRWYDTTRPGQSNQGHDAFLTGADGEWLLSPAERADLISFLQTL